MRHNKQGSALITALFIMTLIAIAATAMSTRLRLDIYRTSTNLNSDRLYLASQAVTFWAMEKLATKDAQFTALDATGLVRKFPKKLQHIYPGVFIEGALYDLQSKINLNSLQDQKLQPLLYHRLENTPENLSSSQRRKIFDATINWIGALQPGQGHDPYASDYLKQTPPYYPAHQPMKTVSEFRLVSGVTAAIYQALLPSITTLPEATPINVGTAPKAVLRSLGNGLSKSQVNDLFLARNTEETLDRTAIAALLKQFNVPGEQITFDSNYFLSVATTSANDSQLTVYTVMKLKRNIRGNPVVSIVSESLNTL